MNAFEMIAYGHALSCNDAADGCLFIIREYAPGDCMKPWLEPWCCGLPRVPRSSYCARHHGETHRKPTEAEKAILRF